MSHYVTCLYTSSICSMSAFLFLYTHFPPGRPRLIGATLVIVLQTSKYSRKLNILYNYMHTQRNFRFYDDYVNEINSLL